VDEIEKVLMKLGLTDRGLIPLVEAIIAKQVSHNTMEETIAGLEEMKFG
jgi:hypothetical protein